MSNKVLFWRVLKILNLNKFFRRNLKTLRYVGKFYIKSHPLSKYWYEAVRLEGFNDSTKKVIVRKVINDFKTVEVEPEKLFLNAYR